MDWTAAKVILDAAALLISICVGIYAWWANRSRARREEIQALRDELTADEKILTQHAGRMAGIEKDLANQPSHADINALRQTVSDLSGHVRELNGTMNTVTKFVDMMNEHLLHAAGGRRD